MSFTRIYAGSGNLYSAEYFRLIRQALKPGGIAVQWVAGTEAEHKLIARTFLSVFPQTTVWTGRHAPRGQPGAALQIRRADFERKLQVRACAGRPGCRRDELLTACWPYTRRTR